MKRFHVHVHVRDLSASISFYSKLFDAAPSRVEIDYAKWMLDDPRINFAISTRGAAPGIDHLGVQVDSAEELLALKATALELDTAVLNKGETMCCYARSEKHWIVDPQGIAWEHFRTLENIPIFWVKADEHAPASACCAPGSSRAVPLVNPVRSGSPRRVERP